MSSFSIEERKRKLSLLKIILLGINLLALAAVIVNIFVTASQSFISEILPTIIFVTFFFLYMLAKRGFLVLPALVLVSSLSLLALYFGYRWGIIIPTNWTLTVLSIVIAGVLLSSQFAIVLALFHVFISLLLAYLQSGGKIQFETWDASPTLGSVTVASTIVGVIVLISWLSNREIEKALARAHKSEENLKKERDSLEIKVEERAREIQRIQSEKVMQVYRFADFGKLATGLIHDLANPLNTILLNLDSLKQESTHPKEYKIKEAQYLLRDTIDGAQKMEKFVRDTKLQIRGQQSTSYFNVAFEIDCVLAEISKKAKEAKVRSDFLERKMVHTWGNSFRFHQLAVNLISNAIDAYSNVKRRKNRLVEVKTYRVKNNIFLEVKDYGSGISKKNLDCIFDPFFTTKSNDNGMGIGLSICKDIAEKDFSGKISVESQLQKGSTFTVEFPFQGTI